MAIFDDDPAPKPHHLRLLDQQHLEAARGITAYFKEHPEEDVTLAMLREVAELDLWKVLPVLELLVRRGAIAEQAPTTAEPGSMPARQWRLRRHGQQRADGLLAEEEFAALLAEVSAEAGREQPTM